MSEIETADTKENTTTVRSTTNVLALRLIAVVAIIVLLAMAFLLGRASADTTSPSAQLPEGSTKAQVANFVSETGLIPNEEFATSTSVEKGKEALKMLQDFANQPKRTLGAADAPVTITVLEDFSCPMCTKWQKETMPQLQPLIDAGTVKLQWHNMVIFAEQYGSDLAAHGAIAAMNQGKTWEYVKAAYGLAKDGDHPSYDEATVIQVAQKAGVPDMAKFQQDLKSESTAAQVQTETQSAQSIGIRGTPFFIIGDSVISGAYPTDYFLNTIKYQQFLANR